MNAKKFFCPNCGKEFKYDFGHEELPTTASGSATVYGSSIKELSKDKSEESPFFLLYYPYCGHGIHVTTD